MFPARLYLIWAISAAMSLQTSALPLNCLDSYQQGETGSGHRRLQTASGQAFEAFCLMNGDYSGYIFLGRGAVASIPQLDMSLLSNDNTHVLLLQRTTNGTVKYAKLEQLPFYRDIALSYFHNSWDGFEAPRLFRTFGPELLYIGFLNISTYFDTIPEKRGFLSNNEVIDHWDCHRTTPNSHLAFYPNVEQHEQCTLHSYQPGTFEFLDSLLPSSQQVHYEIMEYDDYLFTLETHWGGCGFHYSSAGCPGIDGYAVGLPFEISKMTSTTARTTTTSTTTATTTTTHTTDPLCTPTPQGCRVVKHGDCVGQPDQTCGVGVMVDILSCYDPRTGTYVKRTLKRFCCIAKCQGDPCDSVEYKLKKCPWFDPIYEESWYDLKFSGPTTKPDPQSVLEARCWSADCCWDIDNPAGIRCHMKRPPPEVTCNDVYPNCYNGTEGL